MTHTKTQTGVRGGISHTQDPDGGFLRAWTQPQVCNLQVDMIHGVSALGMQELLVIYPWELLLNTVTQGHSHYLAVKLWGELLHLLIICPFSQMLGGRVVSTRKEDHIPWWTVIYRVCCAGSSWEFWRFGVWTTLPWTNTKKCMSAENIREIRTSLMGLSQLRASSDHLFFPDILMVHSQFPSGRRIRK